MAYRTRVRRGAGRSLRYATVFAAPDWDRQFDAAVFFDVTSVVRPIGH